MENKINTKEVLKNIWAWVLLLLLYNVSVWTIALTIKYVVTAYNLL